MTGSAGQAALAAPTPTADRTAGTAVREAAAALEAAGVTSPRLDALMLVAHALSVTPDHVRLRPETRLSASAGAKLDTLVRRRARDREPISRIFGVREFWSLPFGLSADTLDPRPDSECLVEAVLRRIPNRGEPLRLLDLGTGSGCLLLATLSELPGASGLGIDLSPGAVETARRNAVALGLAGRADFRVGDWVAGLGGRYHWILCNPPYIRSSSVSVLPAEVRHDPRRALDGGADGLDAYRTIVRQLPDLLEPDGGAAVEIGADQADPVGRLFEAAGLRIEAVEKDLAGRPRCVLARPGRLDESC